MKAVLIPEEGTPYEVELTEAEGDSTLASLQKLVGGWIEALPVPGRDDATCYVNEEGKFECLPNATATKFMRPVLFPGDTVHGPLIVCGFDASEGVNRPIPDDLREEVIACG